MKWSKLALIAILAASILTACNKDEEQLTQPPAQEETDAQEESVEVTTKEVQEEQADNSFPVPIMFENKKVKLEELPEATQSAIKWSYDYFNTKDIKTEDEFYEMMKNKHYIMYYPDNKIPPDIDKPNLLIAGYGSEMLPSFTSGQVVEEFEVWPEVPVGLNIKVPLYLKIKGKENMQAIAVVYFPDEKRSAGADPEFPMALD